MSDNITLPREHIDYAAHALEHFNKDAPDPLVSEIIHHLRTALAAEQPKPEPVAWRPRLSPNLCFHWSRPWSEGVPSEQTVDYWNQKGAGVEYAYAAPPDAEALRRDAERYRWLRNEHSRIDPCIKANAKYRLERDSSTWVNIHDLDAAIDAAMEGKR